MIGRWQMIGALVLGVLLFSVNVTVLNVVQWIVARDLGATPTEVAWAIYAYLFAFMGVLIPLKARKSVLLSGLVIFGLVSLLCGFAVDGGMLIGGRAMQGLAAAVVVRVGFALVAAAFRGAQLWQAAGMLIAALLVGLTAGPVLGVAIAEYFSYQWILLINVPLVVIVLVAAAVFTPGSGSRSVPRRSDSERLDPA
jgi:DHA2 family multidrug resistance protein-like MFS transporter